MKKHTILRCCLIVGALIFATQALAVGNYDLSWHTLPAGGGMNSTGGAYTLSGSTGIIGTGSSMSGGQYIMAGGFWARMLMPMPENVFITEQELYQQMQTEIATNPAITGIAFALADFAPGQMRLTIRLTDGTVGEVVVSVVDSATGYVTMQIASMTVSGMVAPAAYADTINRELMPLLIASLDALIVEKVGVWQNLASMTITDTIIDLTFSSP